MADNAKGLAKLQTQLTEVKVEISGLLADLATEKRAENGADESTPATTATAVKQFFRELAPQVASHAEGQARIASIMAMLDELLQASQAAMPVGGRSATQPELGKQNLLPEAETTEAAMELDDETLNDMAEAAVPPAAEGEAAQEDRKSKVAEAKARLKSAPGLASRVRKSAAKR